MKGTIAILGCLFAAYAAPLFANEVPLILEETIQLPVVPEVWDVAKTGDSEYTWVMGEGILSAGFLDSGSIYFAGNSTLGVVDTFFAGPYGGNSGRGWPKFAEIFRVSDTTVQCMVMSTYIESCTGGGETNIQRYDFNSRQRLSNVRRQSFCDRPSNVPGMRCWCNYHFSGLAAVPSYPFTSQWFTAAESYYTTESEDHTPNHIYTDLFGTGGAIWTDANISIGTFSQWAFQHYYAFVDDGQDFCATFPPIDCPIVRKYVISDGQANATSFWETTEQELEECLELLCTWDEQIEAALVILRTPDSLKAWSDTSGSTIWRRGWNIGAALLADAVPGLSGEELLVAEPQFELLHIRRPQDYSFWGQTSSFGTGYDEIKIVSRYDQEYRRLVVRYGNELRIYRFGDPIYTDADDARPELPSELTLSAYPNPFNPATMIAFELPKAAQANLVIFDLTGRQVATLFDEQMSVGPHEFRFDGANLPSGIYFARLSAGEMARTHKLVLMK